jgi:LemA protein
MEKTGLAILSIVGVIAVVVILVVIGVVFYAISAYNGLTKLDVEVKAAWSQVENQLQRRNDLIPNLVATVKGFAKQEKSIFENVANARAKLAGASSREDKISAANEVSGALSRLLMVVENYPQLKSDANFRQLMDELAGTENRISVERMRYNEVVKEFNQSIRVFPKNIIANSFNFKEAKLFEAAAGAKEVPKVDFNQ